MAARPLRESDARLTYRHLRIGMILAVVLLATSILIQHGEEARRCWQTSISAYYYTPVRAIFVGGMIAVGFALIVIQGRSTVEDIFLNVAGMFAPVVAIVPTAEGDTCLRFGEKKTPAQASAAEEVLDSVKGNIDNNMESLLVIGFLGLVVALVLAILVNRSMKEPVRRLRRGTRISLAITLGLLLVGWWALERWDSFYTRAHGFAAVAMFVALIGAVACKALEKLGGLRNAYFWIYASVAVLMAVGGAIYVLKLGGAHTVFVLEAWEIALFAAFWIVQTRENWDEVASPRDPPEPSAPSETSWPWQVADHH